MLDDSKTKDQLIKELGILRNKVKRLNELDTVDPRSSDTKKKKHKDLKSKQKISEFINTINEGLLFYDKKGRISTVNSAFEKMSGYKSSDLHGKVAKDMMANLIKSESQKMAEDLLTSNTKNRTDSPTTFTLISKSGHEIPVDATTLFYNDSNGNLTANITVIKDIRRHKMVEDELAENEEKYQELFNLSPMGLAFFDLNGKYLEVNDAYAEIYGSQKETFIGKTIAEIIHQNEPNMTQKDINELLAKGITEGVRELQIQGQSTVLSYINSLIFDKNRKPSGIISMIQDVTLRKRTEEELKETRNHLEELVEERTIELQTEVNERIRAERKIDHLNNILKAIRNVNQLITKEKNVGKLLNGTCKTLINNRSYHNAWIALFDNDKKYVTSTQAGWDKSFQKLSEQLEQGKMNDCLKKAMDTDEVFLIKSPAVSCKSCPMAKPSVGRSAMCVRLAHDGRFLGFLSVSIPKTRTLDTEEKILFNEVADDISFALYDLEAEAERKNADKELKRNIDLLSETQSVANLGSWEWKPDSNDMLWTNEMFRIFGFRPGEIKADFDQWFKMIHTSDFEKVEKFFQDVYATSKEVTLEYRIIRNDGVFRHVQTKGRSQFDKKTKSTRITGIVQDITERKHSEEALRGSEEKWRSLTEYSADNIFTIDLDYNILFINQVVPGLTKEGTIGKSIYFFIPKKFHESVKQCFDRILKTKQPDKYYHDFTGPDGTNYYFEARVAPMLKTGEVTGFTISGTDITERKKAEEALVASEVSYQKLFETAQDGILLIDADTRKITDVNPFLTELLGYTHQDLQGKELWEIGPFKDIASSKTAFKELQKREYIRYEDLPLETKEGKSIAVEFVSNVYLVDGKKVIQCNIRDITERKKAEEALVASEVSYQKLFETAQDGILLIDADTGKITDVNPFLTELLGYTHQDLQGKELWEIGPFKDIASSKTAFKEMQKREYIRYEDLPLETKEGKSIAVEFVSNVYQVYGRNVIQCNIRDITVRKKAEDKLKEYSENLEEMVEARTQELRDTQQQLVKKEKLAVLGQLAGGVGHELRNPLGAIKNAAYFLNMAIENPEPEVKETLEIIDAEVTTSDRIISNLLDFTRTKPLIRRKVDINDIVRKSVSRTTVQENINVVSQLDKALPTTLADSDQLKQIFENIITNAIQAMDKGGQLTIKSKMIKPEQIVVSFTDTGVGIPEENLEKLFEPLFTTKAKGIGLGLVVVKSLIEGHGGTIDVKSDPGKGSTFTILLPTNQKRGE